LVGCEEAGAGPPSRRWAAASSTPATSGSAVHQGEADPAAAVIAYGNVGFHAFRNTSMAVEKVSLSARQKHQPCLTAITASSFSSCVPCRPDCRAVSSK
jgi:hypothetical protein